MVLPFPLPSFSLEMQGEHGCPAEGEAARGASTDGDACRGCCDAHVGVRLQLRARAAVRHARCCEGCVIIGLQLNRIYNCCRLAAICGCWLERIQMQPEYSFDAT